MGTENLSKPSISSYIQERQKQIDDERIADIAEIQRFYSSVLRGEVKDQFGLDASLETRIAAGRELMKRFEKSRKQIKNDSRGITIINNIPRPEKQDG